MTGTANRSGGDRRVGADKTPDNGPPDMPTGMSAEAGDKWRELLKQLPAGVLRKIDSHQLRLLSELLSQSDALAKVVAADPANDKPRRLYLQTCDRVQRLSALFGLSPADRKRVGLDGKAEIVNPVFDAWIAGGGLN